MRIIPFMNGVFHARRIAKESNVHISLVLRALSLLVHYRLVKLVDIFQYSNVYIPTRDISRLYRDQVLQRECERFVRVAGPDLSAQSDEVLDKKGNTSSLVNPIL